MQMENERESLLVIMIPVNWQVNMSGIMIWKMVFLIHIAKMAR